jgi:peptidoglycan/LPS O-acetylase OafA/YrhL
LFVSLYAHLAEGPKWYKDKSMLKNCDAFYKVVFFIDDFIGGGICIGASWYLHVDMQLYCTAMILLMLYKYSRFASKLTLWLVSSGFFIKSLVYSYMHETKILIDYNNSVKLCKLGERSISQALALGSNLLFRLIYWNALPLISRIIKTNKKTNC